MPFRHLLFNRRDGAPQRAPNQPPISLEAARYFSLENEFATYNRWPEVDYTNNHSPVAYNFAGMQSQSVKTLDSAQHSPMEHTNLMDVLPYQNYLHELNSGAQPYSPELMDTDTSSISYSSVSSRSRTDPTLDDDSESSYFTSRKASLVSSVGSEQLSTEKVPTRTERHRESGLYGSNNPNGQSIRVQEGLIGNSFSHPRNQQTSNVNAARGQPINIIVQTATSQTPLQPQGFPLPSPCATSPESAQSLPIEDTKPRPRGRRPTSKSSTSSIKDDSKQVRKTRARQAHSQVERRYRENLNAKIQDLHRTLQTAQYGKQSSQTRVDEDEDDSEEQEQGKTSSKFKKSDVLVEAISYVHTTEAEMKLKEEEIERLNGKVRLMENWIRNNAPR